MTMNDIKNDELEMPKVNRADFDKSKINCKPSVNKALIGEFEKWTKEFGQDGWYKFPKLNINKQIKNNSEMKKILQ